MNPLGKLLCFEHAFALANHHGPSCPSCATRTTPQGRLGSVAEQPIRPAIATHTKMHYTPAMQNDMQITVRIPGELNQAITDLADELKLSRSEVIRQALTAGILEGKQAAKNLRNPAFRTLVKALLAIQGDDDQLDLFERAIAAGAVPEA